jgi:hypothetical protein
MSACIYPFGGIIICDSHVVRIWWQYIICDSHVVVIICDSHVVVIICDSHVVVIICDSLVVRIWWQYILGALPAVLGPLPVVLQKTSYDSCIGCARAKSGRDRGGQAQTRGIKGPLSLLGERRRAPGSNSGHQGQVVLVGRETARARLKLGASRAGCPCWERCAPSAWEAAGRSCP